MDIDKKPQGRQRNVSGKGSGLNRKGSGLGTGPVGDQSGYSGRGNGNGGGGSKVTRGVGLSLPVIIIMVLVYMFGGGNLLGGGGGGNVSYDYGSSNQSSQGSFGGYLEDGTTESTPGASSNQGTVGSWAASNSGGNADTEVASSAREKRTVIKGNGSDVVTIMVYLCGTDLESRSKMATSDLQEMVSANISDNINLIVYTGGCSRWNNNVVSSRTNQIYQIKQGGLLLLEKSLGEKPMTDPETLTYFIKYCKKNFPANRNELIFWDHGAGSVSGYGYDEKFKSSGSMSLAGINKALKNGGVTFDFVGFDACLMATTETALMMDRYADYLIASEETEPGIGWYYTNWLNALSKNTSMPTLELGQRIVDDFVATCAKRTPGQGTTLSVTDLAELSATVPAKLEAFSRSVTKSIEDKDYSRISRARSGSREFAKSTGIDQIDLAHFADNIGSKEGSALAEAIRGAVKYNRTSPSMTNSNGLSIYFPYRSVKNVVKATQDYSEIGMDEEYAHAIRAFASLEISGQAASGGSTYGSPIPSLFGTLLGGAPSGSSSGYSGYSGGTGTSPYGSSGINEELIGQLLGSFLGGDYSSISGLSSSNAGFLTDRALSDEDTVQYINDNHIDTSALYWTESDDGSYIMTLPRSQWELVQTLVLNPFYDDGEGFIDLGYDNIYQFDDDGNLVADEGKYWLAINGQVVPYYHLDSIEDGDYWNISGRVPALLNGERVDLIIVFDNDNPSGYVAGARTDYRDEEIEAIAKNLTEIKDGDTIDFLCDFYSYEGEYQDSYVLGNRMTVRGDLKVTDVELPEGRVRLCYRLDDIYNQSYWTESIDR